jgi:hypothetical protein
LTVHASLWPPPDRISIALTGVPPMTCSRRSAGENCGYLDDPAADDRLAREPCEPAAFVADPNAETAGFRMFPGAGPVQHGPQHGEDWGRVARGGEVRPVGVIMDLRRPRQSPQSDCRSRTQWLVASDDVEAVTLVP